MTEPLPATLFDRLVARAAAPAPAGLAISTPPSIRDVMTEGADDERVAMPAISRAARPPVPRPDDRRLADAPPRAEQPSPRSQAVAAPDEVDVDAATGDPVPATPASPRVRTTTAAPSVIAPRAAIPVVARERSRAVTTRAEGPPPARTRPLAPTIEIGALPTVKPARSPSASDGHASALPVPRGTADDRQPGEVSALPVLPAWAVVRPDLPALVAPVSRPAPAAAVVPSEPVVHVTIGRLEVRGTTDARSVERRERPRPGPTLEAFLSRRGGPV